MSSPWTIVSPSHVALGPGGALRVPIRERYVSTRSASDLPDLTSAIFLLDIAAKSKRLAIIAPKNFGGVICAVAIMCASTSRLDQPAASDGASHADGGRAARA